MILLLDEQLDSPDMAVARSLDILGAAYDLQFRSLRTEAAGLKDPKIPAYCGDNGIDALVSANFRDFGAKEALYAALLAAGVSVVVIRPEAKKSVLVEGQVSLLSKHLKRIGRDLADARAAGECILLRVNESGCVRRTLEELRAEIRARESCPSRREPAARIAGGRKRGQCGWMISLVLLLLPSVQRYETKRIRVVIE